VVGPGGEAGARTSGPRTGHTGRLADWAAPLTRRLAQTSRYRALTKTAEQDGSEDDDGAAGALAPVG
jgi:hypothetical protein